MKYLSLVCGDDTVELSPAEEAAMGPATDAWVNELDARGIRLLGNGLRPVSDATTVRAPDGKVLVYDGPFAETKEYIAGFDIFQCPSMEEAVDAASRHPVVAYGPLEVRPFAHPDEGAVFDNPPSLNDDNGVNYFFFHCIPVVDPFQKHPREEIDALLARWLEETVPTGINRGGALLAPATAAQTVRRRDGEKVVLDGPFAETTEYVAGFDIIHCPDLDAAIEIASRHPTTLMGSIELRPIWPF